MEDVSFLQFCLQNHKESLISQCTVPENKGFDPEKTGYASHRKIWWICEKGHKWQAAISDRTTKDAGCPYCTNRKALKGYNDLARINPELAAQWHPTKNGVLTPETVTPGSSKNVWWRCDLGHEWQAVVGNRALKGHGCPYCTGKKAWPGFNDLATMEPELMREWHPVLNQGLDPTRLMPRSRKRVWWRCAEGHEWETYLFNRTIYHSGCPFCAGKVSKSRAVKWAVYVAEREAECFSIMGKSSELLQDTKTLPGEVQGLPQRSEGIQT